MDFDQQFSAIFREAFGEDWSKYVLPAEKQKPTSSRVTQTRTGYRWTLLDNPFTRFLREVVGVGEIERAAPREIEWVWRNPGETDDEFKARVARTKNRRSEMKRIVKQNPRESDDEYVERLDEIWAELWQKEVVQDRYIWSLDHFRAELGHALNRRPLLHREFVETPEVIPSREMPPSQRIVKERGGERGIYSRVLHVLPKELREGRPVRGGYRVKPKPTRIDIPKVVEQFFERIQLKRALIQQPYEVFMKFWDGLPTDVFIHIMLQFIPSYELMKWAVGLAKLRRLMTFDPSVRKEYDILDTKLTHMLLDDSFFVKMLPKGRDYVTRRYKSPSEYADVYGLDVRPEFRLCCEFDVDAFKKHLELCNVSEELLHIRRRARSLKIYAPLYNVDRFGHFITVLRECQMKEYSENTRFIHQRTRHTRPRTLTSLIDWIRIRRILRESIYDEAIWEMVLNAFLRFSTPIKFGLIRFIEHCWRMPRITRISLLIGEIEDVWGLNWIEKLISEFNFNHITMLQVYYVENVDRVYTKMHVFYYVNDMHRFGFMKRQNPGLLVRTNRHNMKLRTAHGVTPRILFWSLLFLNRKEEDYWRKRILPVKEEVEDY